MPLALPAADVAGRSGGMLLGFGMAAVLVANQ